MLCLDVTLTAHRFGIEFLLRLMDRRNRTPLRNFFTRWRWAVGAFHAKSHVRRCKWLHGQYRHEGTGEAQGDGTEVVNVFWKQYHNMLSALGPALYDATVELIADWWNEQRPVGLCRRRGRAGWAGSDRAPTAATGTCTPT